MVENELQIIHVGVGKNQTKTLSFEDGGKQMTSFNKCVIVMGIITKKPRSTLTEISEQTGIPVSTVFDILIKIENVFELKGEWIHKPVLNLKEEED